MSFYHYALPTMISESLQKIRGVSELLLRTIIVPGNKTSEGRLIEAVAIPWFEIVKLLRDDPNVAFQIPPDRWEEIIAGAYRQAGFEERSV